MIELFSFKPFKGIYKFINQDEQIVNDLRRDSHKGFVLTCARSFIINDSCIPQCGGLNLKVESASRLNIE